MKKSTAQLGAMAMAVATVVAACGSSSSSTKAASTAGGSSASTAGNSSATTAAPTGNSSGAPIKIAVIAPFSGGEGYLGTPTLNGIQMALKTVGGTVAGRQVQVVKYDDQCTPTNAVQIVRRIQQDSSVTAVFGPICSGDMSATQQTMAASKIVHVTNGYGANLTSSGDKYIFVGVDNNNQQVAAMQPQIAKWAPKTAGIIHGNDGFSTSLAETEKALLQKDGINVVYDGTIQDSATDYSGAIGGFKSSGASLLMIGAYESTTGALIKQLRQEGVTAPVASPNGCDPAVTQAGGTFIDNVAFALNYCPTNPATQSFTDSYKSAYGSTPDDAVAGAYTTALALFKGLEASGGKGGAALRSAMIQLHYQSPLGLLSYQSDGSLASPQIVTGVMHGGTATFSSGS